MMNAVLKFTKPACLLITGWLMVSCLSEEELNSLLDATSDLFSDSTSDLDDDSTSDLDDDSTSDLDDGSTDDAVIPPPADVVPSSVLVSHYVNDTNIAPTDENNYIPGPNNPADVVAADARLYMGHLTYDQASNKIYFSTADGQIYTADLNTDMVSWFAGTFGGSKADLFGTTGDALSAFPPRMLDLRPRGLAVNAEYLYISTPASIVRLLLSGADTPAADILFAGTRDILISPGNNDLDANGLAQTKGLVDTDMINLYLAEGINAHNNYLYVQDKDNFTLRAISFYAEGGKRHLFNYYQTFINPLLRTPPDFNFYNLLSSTLHDDGYLYVAMSFGNVLDQPNFRSQIMKLPGLDSLTGDEYEITTAENFFSGTTSDQAGALAGDENSVFFPLGHLISAGSLLYHGVQLATDQIPVILVIKDDGSVVNLPIVFADPANPTISSGNLFMTDMVPVTERVFYANNHANLFKLELQYDN